MDRRGGALRLARWSVVLPLTLALTAAACTAPIASVAPSASAHETPIASDSVAPRASPPLNPVVASPPPPAAAWQAQPIAPRGRIQDLIRLGNGSYIAVGALGWNGAIWRSTNGANWVEVTDVPPIGAQDAKGLTGVVETADGFLAWGGGGARYSEGGFTVIWTSTDGSAWTERARWTGFLTDVVEGGPGFIGVGSEAGLDNLYGALAWSSADGITWTDSPPVPGPGASGMRGLVPFEAGFLAVGASRDQSGGADGIAWRSDDGILWSQTLGANLQGTGLSDVILIDGRLIAASWTTLHTTIYGEVDRTGIRISDDGSSWRQAYAPECCGQMLDVVDTGRGLLALYRWYLPGVRDGVGLLRSIDGTSWDEIGAPQVDEGVIWVRLLNVGGDLGVIGLALQPIPNDEYQPVLLLPPPDLGL